MSTKHDAMKTYLEAEVLEVAGSVLNFNFSSDTPDSIAFITEYADKDVKKYLRGNALKAYGFAILITKCYSTNTDDLNITAMNAAHAFGDWIDAQDKLKSFPDFGIKCQVKKIEFLQNMPNLADIDMEQGIAKYMLQCRVTYYEEV
jgi:hypothetical protein